MHLFWYHSPVRFYRSLEELEDRTNPQNNQYFGNTAHAYPLEADEYHRFLIPNYKNEVSGTDLSLWLVNDKETQIPCEFGIDNGKLYRITFISDISDCGRLEVRVGGKTFFYSNTVQFVNSELPDGRKFIRIATKHLYDRKLFKFSGGFDWIVTNLPAYCLGMFQVNAEVNNSRTGGNNTLKVKDVYLDESVSYEFISEGDANILSFIQVHSTNNHFYIDGTRRTALDKLDVDDFMMSGRLSFTNVKNSNGLNEFFDEKEIFKDVMRYVLSDNNKTMIYTYNNNKNAIPTDGRYS